MIDGITKEAWVVYLHGPRGEPRLPLCVCELQATARRFARTREGLPGNVVKVEVVWKDNGWFGPVEIQRPNHADTKEQNKFNAYEAAIERARCAGLSDGDLAVLRKGPR